MSVVSASRLKQIYSKVSRIHPRLVGLDVGTTFVGVALSDPFLKVALPQTTLRRSSCVSPLPENLLYPILKENKVFAMIVGFPYLVDGSESVQCEDVKFFVHDFLKNSGISIPIVYHNELYTTQIAMEPYSGKRRRDWNEGLRRKDQNAAAVILQEFLDDFLVCPFCFCAHNENYSCSSLGAKWGPIMSFDMICISYSF